MIRLFTDFGWQGPYVGEMKAAIAAVAPSATVIDLMHDAPAFRPDLAGRLLAALVAGLPAPSVIVAVVDPGVGTDRAPLVVEAAGHRLVGPDNGLFAPLFAINGARVRTLDWRPERPLSASFHGRDLFAPAAARLWAGLPVPTRPGRPAVATPGPAERIVYVDGFGNAMTGLAADQVPAGSSFRLGGERLARLTTFAEAPAGGAFWYRNSLGLAEIAVNQGSAAARFGLAPGTQVCLA